MRRVYTYLIERDGARYIRIISGQLAGKMMLDYRHAIIKELKITAAFALKHMYQSNTEEGKILQEIGLDNLFIYKVGRHIKLVKSSDLKDIGLFHVAEFLLNNFNENIKNIHLNRISF